MWLQSFSIQFLIIRNRLLNEHYLHSDQRWHSFLLEIKYVGEKTYTLLTLLTWRWNGLKKVSGLYLWDFTWFVFCPAVNPGKNAAKKSAAHRATAISFVNKLLCKSFNRFGIENNLNNHTYTLYSRQRLVWEAANRKMYLKRGFLQPSRTQVKLIVYLRLEMIIHFCMWGLITS